MAASASASCFASSDDVLRAVSVDDCEDAYMVISTGTERSFVGVKSGWPASVMVGLVEPAKGGGTDELADEVDEVDEVPLADDELARLAEAGTVVATLVVPVTPALVVLFAIFVFVFGGGGGAHEVVPGSAVGSMSEVADEVVSKDCVCGTETASGWTDTPRRKET